VPELSATEELLRDHELLLSQVEDLRASLLALRPGAVANLELAEGRLRARTGAFWKDLRLHFLREEIGLFAEAHRLVTEAPQPDRPLAAFLAGETEEDLSAHVGISKRMNEAIKLVEEIEAAGLLATQDLARLRTMVGIALGLLSRHAAKEESLIFPTLARALTPRQLAAIRTRLRETPLDPTAPLPSQGLEPR
jgi:hemerythrin-like domain-containing protein